MMGERAVGWLGNQLVAERKRTAALG
jgi:hypothetical protein